jgi:glycosyltransferase involved in cell wall biosynthesis
MLAKLCEALPRERVQSSVVSLRSGPLAHRLRAAGVPVVECSLRASALPTPGAIRQVAGAIAATRPHLVQGWMYHGNLAALLRPPGTPVMWNVRQTLYGLNRERPLTRVVIWSSAAASRIPRVIVYNSSVSARQHVARGFRADRTRIIPNGFDTRQFAPSAERRAQVRAELGIAADQPVVGLVARVHPMKDHAMFLRAARAISARIPNMCCLLIGDGATDAALGDTVRDMGLSGHVRLMGPRADIAELTAALDVACSSSAWGEGFPNVLGEALACEVPCVATDVGDSRDVVGDGGMIVPPGDAPAFANAVIALLTDSVRRTRAGAAGRRRVLERFSIDAVAREYADLWESNGPPAAAG